MIKGAYSEFSMLPLKGAWLGVSGF